MAIRDMKPDESGGAGQQKGAANEHSGADHDETCRCKETSTMTPAQLLRLMFNDLAFWKKAKKG